MKRNADFWGRVISGIADFIKKRRELKLLRLKEVVNFY